MRKMSGKRVLERRSGGAAGARACQRVRARTSARPALLALLVA